MAAFGERHPHYALAIGAAWIGIGTLLRWGVIG